METLNNENDAAGKAPQLREDELRRKRDEDLRDDDKITSSKVADSNLPKSKSDEDDDIKHPDKDNQHRVDDPVHGHDLNIDDTDEWDADKLTKQDFDEDDLHNDDEEVTYEKKNKKYETFGSLEPYAAGNRKPGEKKNAQ